MKKLVSTLMIGAMTASLLAGCGSTAANSSSAAAGTAATAGSGNALKLCLASEPDHLDPALN